MIQCKHEREVFNMGFSLEKGNECYYAELEIYFTYDGIPNITHLILWQFLDIV